MAGGHDLLMEPLVNCASCHSRHGGGVRAKPCHCLGRQSRVFGACGLQDDPGTGRAQSAPVSSQHWWSPLFTSFHDVSPSIATRALVLLPEAQLQDYIVRLAAIPAIQGPLEYIAEATNRKSTAIGKSTEPSETDEPFAQGGHSARRLACRAWPAKDVPRSLSSHAAVCSFGNWLGRPDAKETMLWLFLILANLVAPSDSAEAR